MFLGVVNSGRELYDTRPGWINGHLLREPRAIVCHQSPVRLAPQGWPIPKALLGENPQQLWSCNSEPDTFDILFTSPLQHVTHAHWIKRPGTLLRRRETLMSLKA